MDITMPTIEHYSKEIGPVHLPTSGSVINLLVDQQYSYTHIIRLLKQYFPNSSIQVAKHSEYAEIKNHPHLTLWLTVTNPTHLNTAQSEGSFSIQTGKLHHAPALLINGCGLAGAIYAINELGLKHLKMSANEITIPLLDLQQSPALPYRLFWTWDHSTNWFLTQNGQQDIGFANPYLKPEEGFLQDYQRLIDFMSLNRINGVTIYGFLRDSHGGIAAAQEICRYANERGVRILPGVGINSYGGIYWEGKHHYNLSQWLRQNPSLRAQFDPLKVFELPDFVKLYIPETHYLDAACPSKTANHEYHIEAIQWLTETFAIGGINFETGDYGACQCTDCTKRRAVNLQWSLADMALLYPRLFAAARQGNNSENLWLVCESYWDNLLDLDQLSALADLPDEAVYQFCINRSYWPKLQAALTNEYIKKLPHSKNILRTHMGSQWQGERYELIAQRYAAMMRLSYDTGMKGASIFGEASAFNTVNEINYLAFARFGYDASLTWENFVANDLDPLLGGAGLSEQYLTLLMTENNARMLKYSGDIARQIATTLSGEIYRRWLWLQNHLMQKLAMLA